MSRSLSVESTIDNNDKTMATVSSIINGGCKETTCASQENLNRTIKCAIYSTDESMDA